MGSRAEAAARVVAARAALGAEAAARPLLGWKSLAQAARVPAEVATAAGSPQLPQPWEAAAAAAAAGWPSLRRQQHFPGHRCCSWSLGLHPRPLRLRRTPPALPQQSTAQSWFCGSARPPPAQLQGQPQHAQATVGCPAAAAAKASAAAGNLAQSGAGSEASPCRLPRRRALNCGLRQMLSSQGPLGGLKGAVPLVAPELEVPNAAAVAEAVQLPKGYAELPGPLEHAIRPAAPYASSAAVKVALLATGRPALQIGRAHV